MDTRLTPESHMCWITPFSFIVLLFYGLMPNISLRRDNCKYSSEDDMEMFYPDVSYCSDLWLPYKKIDKIKELVLSMFFDECDEVSGHIHLSMGFLRDLEV